MDHTGTSGSFRADTLDGNLCATDDPDATGAIGQNVRSTSMALRRAYRSLDSTFSQTGVKDVVRPSGAPFTDADLTCAQNQMVDEIAARTAVAGTDGQGGFMNTLRDLGDPGQTLADLDQIAENVKTGALSSISTQLQEEGKSTTSFWANFAFGALTGVMKISQIFAPEESVLLQAFNYTALASQGGQSIFNAIDGRRGNPVALTNDYILLAAQLDQQAEEVEVQIENVLAAQKHGVVQTQEIVLSDPHRLAEVSANSKGKWAVTATELQTAQDAYLHRVTQLAYQDFWPQIYTGIRFNYANSCQGSSDLFTILCWSDGAWRERVSAGEFTPLSKTQASQAACQPNDVGDIPAPFPGANPGSPVGLGKGTEYQPVASVATKGSAPLYLDYVMVESSSLTGGRPTLSDFDTASAIFAQPGTVEDAAGFYAPDFWHQNLELDAAIACTAEGQDSASTDPRTSTRSTGGVYEDIQDGGLWPTPPR